MASSGDSATNVCGSNPPGMSAQFNPLPDGLIFLGAPSTRAMVGNRFNRWRVIMLGARRVTSPRNFRDQILCQCDCGTIKLTSADHVRNGRSKDCGCGRKVTVGRLFTKHGFLADGRAHQPPEYAVWSSMLARCYIPSNRNYIYYGGRGIATCDRWRYGENGETGFACFYKDMGPRPSDDHQIERVENSGNYEPKNCCWVPRSAQCSNTRRNRRITARGLTMTVSQWARHLGLSPLSIGSRLHRGWSEERALFQPIGKIGTNQHVRQ